MSRTPQLQESLQELADRALVISFDFFDTLFVRPLANPEDAFDILGNQFNLVDFRRMRRAAQTEAFQRMQAAGRKEISLREIYLCFPDTGHDPAKLMEAEIALELALVEPNPEVAAVFCAMVATGKQVVIVSDMYLSADFFVRALQSSGMAQVPLFISADLNATKRDTGELFEIVARDLNVAPADILHIGDNLLADVTRAQEKGLLAFHYKPENGAPAKKPVTLTASIGYGLLQTSAKSISPGTFGALGFNYGGPANLGFLEWIRKRAQQDGIDHLLFLSRDGYALERIAKRKAWSDFPDFHYFLGSRVAYTLAATDRSKFSEFIPFFLSGADGLMPSELLERIGVQPPSIQIMEDLGLGPTVKVGPANYDLLTSFAYAYSGEILKVCQRNRRALYLYISQLGIKPGSRVALVDVGWSGTTQEAFEQALRPLMRLDIQGYYFCLADTPERIRRSAKQKMTAMLDVTSTDAATLATIYANRVAVEQFFSAPHHSVIGLEVGATGVNPVMDAGRGSSANLSAVTEEVCSGIAAFSEHYGAFKQRINLQDTPQQLTSPLIELLTSPSDGRHQLLGGIKNFDAWGSSRNHSQTLTDYLKQ